MKDTLKIFAAPEYQGLKFFVNLVRDHKQDLIGKQSVYKCVLRHFPLQKLPDWHHKAGMESRGNPLKESRGER